MYSTLLRHFASYGFTVIAATLANTGSGKEINAAAHYLVTQNGAAGSIFKGNLEVTHVAAVGHSQGAGGATRAATNDPALSATLMTFSLPSTRRCAARGCATCGPAPRDGQAAPGRSGRAGRPRRPAGCWG